MARKFSGQRLRQQRLAAGLKPEHLAVRVDRSVYSLRYYERGTAVPSAAVLGALADALGCLIDDLYADDPVAGRAG